MSSVPLETQMLDAIEAELAKIGSDPALEWLTSPTPTLTVGIPGDPIKRPNFCSLYLHHVGSSLGRDDIGINPHRLDCEFDIWCVSSHPNDCSRRAYNLAEDVRRVLLAAEGTFYELFGYGLEWGPLTFTGQDLYTRAGSYAVAQRVRIGGPNEDDMTDERVLELVRQELESRTHQRFDYSDVMPAQGGSTTPGRRSAGFADRPFGSIRGVNLPSVPNSIFEVCKRHLINPGNSPSPFNWKGGPLFSQPFTYSMVINPGNVFFAAAGEALVGIEWGSFKVDPPFSTNYVNAFGGPVFQFRWNYAREKFELVVWDGDIDTAPIVLDCDLQPIFTPDLYIKEFKLEYLPAPGGASVLNAYLNGQLAKSYNGDRLQNCYNQDADMTAGYFTTNGTGTEQIFSDTFFYENHIWIPSFFLYPDPPNPS